MSAAPQPRTSPETDAAPDGPGDAPRAAPQAPATPSARRSRAAGRSLAVALLLGAAGAALALVASGRVWAKATAVVAQGTLPQTADGADVTGVPGALAVVGLAALVAVFAVRRVGRVVVAALLALSGAGVVATAARGAFDVSALRAKAATATGITGAAVHHVTHTPWPWVAALGGLLLLGAGLLALGYGRRWPAMSGRYERAGAAPRPARPAASSGPERPEDLWKSLDRGEDPTR
ncbi:TIGR02234 family membrane protein [Streptomyces sp. NPDC059740]|uniref:TIGR02234 family membrane protein n=1 Tax=Streptomyces sp. NPDC059740 TaxID=3346926 RepID=UPI00366014BE